MVSRIRIQRTGAGLPDHEVLTMPSLSPTMTHGNLIEWKKEEGQEVVAGDVLCVIETDKATLDNESQEDGFLAKILVPSGAKDLPVGTPIAVMVDSAEDVAKFADYSSPSPGSAAPPPPQESEPPPSSPPPPPPPRPPPPSHLGPSVKRLLAQTGLDPNQITGTGPKGYITKGDVLAAMTRTPDAAPPIPPQTPAPAPAPAPAPTLAPSAPLPPPVGNTAPSSKGEFEDVQNSQIRKVIAKRLLESKWGTPHYYLAQQAGIDATLALRSELKSKHGAAVSVNDFVVKAVAMALREVPAANSYFEEESGEVVAWGDVDISVAVATDRGLMTPIVRNADRKSLSAISAEIKELAEKARSGKLKPAEFQGGSFSISNLGMFPVDRFCAIINPPQAGILAIGRGVKVVQWQEKEDGSGTGRPITVTKMEVTLSADHRVLDGDVGAEFLSVVCANLANPRRLLL